ncbi:MAG: nucleoside-diphosphate kinase [Candidatus Atabeyarchaeum deiterrae]
MTFPVQVMKLIEETLLVLKPDAIVRRFVSVEALKILLSRGFGVRAFKEMLVSSELARKHYSIHESKPFYEWLIKFITSGPVLAMRVESEGVIQEIRKMLGSTFAHKAEPESLRGKYGIYGGVNVAHASDSDKTSLEEIGLWESEVGLSRNPQKTVAKQIDAYIELYESKPYTDHTRELRSACMGIVEGRIKEETGRNTLSRLLASEIQDADKKYLKGFSDAVLETCLMDRRKK